MSLALCPGLINSSYDVNLRPVRISVLSDCNLFSPLILNSVINAIKRPYRLSLHNNIISGSRGQWSGVLGDLIYNRSDICGDFHSINYDRHRLMDNSPILGYSYAITIFSGKIYDHSPNVFHVFDRFSFELWTIYAIMLLLVAIVSEVIDKNSILAIASILKMFDNYFALMMQFLSQPQKYFKRICCTKHYVMNSATLIAITLMTIFFNTKFSSDLIHNPLLRIDSTDDLAQFISQHSDVKIIADGRSTSWNLFMEWQNQETEIIKKRLMNVPVHKFNYEDVFNGKTLIIGHEVIFNIIINVNPELNFHISNDRQYGLQFGLLYSKSIDKDLKQLIDAVCMALFESGLQKAYRPPSKRL